MSNKPRGRPRLATGPQLRDLERYEGLSRREQAVVLNALWAALGEPHSPIAAPPRLRGEATGGRWLSLEEYARALLDHLPPSPGSAIALRRDGRDAEAGVADVHDRLEVAVRRVRRLDKRRRETTTSGGRQPQLLRALRAGELVGPVDAPTPLVDDADALEPDIAVELERFRQHLAAALTVHPEQDEIDERLRRWEQFFVVPSDGGMEIRLGDVHGLLITTRPKGAGSAPATGSSYARQRSG